MSLEAVVAEHSEGLLALPAVVGVAAGRRDDGVPCVVVMVTGRSPEVDESVPEELGGYTVEVRVTGEIRAR